MNQVAAYHAPGDEHAHDYSDSKGEVSSKPARSSAPPATKRSEAPAPRQSLRRSMSLLISGAPASSSEQPPSRVECAKERASLTKKSAMKLGLDLDGNVVDPVASRRRNLLRVFSSPRLSA
jgi:hypothetical protein